MGNFIDVVFFFKLLQVTQRSFEPLRTTTLVAIPLYTFFFSMGAGPVPWLLYSEVFPTRIRSRATAGKFIFIFTWAIRMTSCFVNSCHGDQLLLQHHRGRQFLAPHRRFRFEGYIRHVRGAMRGWVRVCG